METVALEPETESLLLLLLCEGGRADAICVYQEEAGAALHEAEQVIAQLAKKHGVSSRRHEALSLVLVAVAFLAGVAMFF